VRCRYQARDGYDRRHFDAFKIEQRMSELFGIPESSI
jgi:hypothetical protein